MPTYEYRCRSCAHEFERFQGITERPVRRCPRCGRNTVQRLIGTGAGIIFKGSGFYETDYRSKSYSEGAKSESAASGAGSGACKSECSAAAKKECAAKGGSCETKKKR
jgi:putative FmdB family regulatory protein